MPQISPTFWPWLRERLFPRGTNLIMWASFVIIISMIVIYVLQRPDVTPLQFNTTVLSLAVLLVINIVWDDLKARFSNETRGIWVLLLVSTALTFLTIFYGRMFTGIYLLFMIIAQTNAMLHPRPALAYSVLTVAVYFGLMLNNGISPGNMGEFVVSLLIGFVFVVTLSQVLNRYSEQSEHIQRILSELQEANLALMEASENEKELTIAEERLRMARDLHDGLGHHLTALSVQLQAAEKLMQANPALAAETVRNARGEVQAALKEVRQSVAALRETPVDMMDLPQAVRRLLEETGQLSGLQTVFNQRGQTAALSPAAAMTIYRAAQEGLTNVRKHASGATHVSVELAYSPSQVQISVENDGPASSDMMEAGGFGLAGLHERASLLGGTLECGPRPEGGFIMHLQVPLEARP